MAKLTHKSIDGTSFHDVKVRTTASILEQVYGKPQSGGDDKVNWDWHLETTRYKDEYDSPVIFTLYDWKEYTTNDDKMLEFHIGALSRVESEIAQKEVMKDIANFVFRFR
jgi:hypothetical protein